MRRWFSADFHLGMKDILKLEKRPFANVEEMNNALIDECCNRAAVYVEEQQDGTNIVVDRDVIIHIGDLATFSADYESVNPQQLVSKIPAMFINIRGNHDINNKVKSIATSMRTKLGKYQDVSLGHYPSYDAKAEGTFLPGDIHLCGHVHSSWKHCLDMKNKVLNINVGVDVWNYKLVSEHMLIMYIDKLLKTDMSKINKR